MEKHSIAKWEYGIIALYFALYFLVALSLIYRQPFGDPPDEINRYLIPQYIAEHGTLPNGYDEEIRIPGYGFSYAFQPILPYMIQGYFMRFVSLFHPGENGLVYAARLVDFAFGLVMAVFVLLLGKRLFSDKRLQYLFCFLVMFLPQSIFVHTYINTDSCCMMSIAVMLYGLVRCLQDQFAYPSCVIMSIGIIFCALSYYNAYGFILSCILLFIANYLSWHNRCPRLEFKPFLQKGIFISVIVLLGIGWWFVRSYLLYDGDFLGLRTRDLCSVLYGNEDMKPGVKITYQTLGYTVPGMLLHSDFCVLTINSFICMYGSMMIYTSLWIYRLYKLLFAGSLMLCLLSPVLAFLSPKASTPQTDISGDQATVPKTKQRHLSDSAVFLSERPRLRVFFHINMVICILIPCVLSVIYSYNIDYQPQGRYIMPILIPLVYYSICGIEKGVLLLKQILCSVKVLRESRNQILESILFAGILIFIVLSLLISVYGYVFPYYARLEALM